MFTQAYITLHISDNVWHLYCTKMCGSLFIVLSFSFCVSDDIYTVQDE